MPHQFLRKNADPCCRTPAIVWEELQGCSYPNHADRSERRRRRGGWAGPRADAPHYVRQRRLWRPCWGPRRDAGDSDPRAPARRRGRRASVVPRPRGVRPPRPPTPSAADRRPRRVPNRGPRGHRLSGGYAAAAREAAWGAFQRRCPRSLRSRRDRACHGIGRPCVDPIRPPRIGVDCSRQSGRARNRQRGIRRSSVSTRRHARAAHAAGRRDR